MKGLQVRITKDSGHSQSGALDRAWGLLGRNFLFMEHLRLWGLSLRVRFVSLSLTRAVLVVLLFGQLGMQCKACNRPTRIQSASHRILELRF